METERKVKWQTLDAAQGQKIHLFCNSHACFFQISSMGCHSYHSVEEVTWKAGEQRVALSALHVLLRPLCWYQATFKFWALVPVRCQLT